VCYPDAVAEADRGVGPEVGDEEFAGLLHAAKVARGAGGTDEVVVEMTSLLHSRGGLGARNQGLRPCSSELAAESWWWSGEPIRSPPR
jgi:hypothetical protein